VPDRRGYDDDLDSSRRRANAVIKALAGEHGIAAKCLLSAGVGCLAPSASDDDASCRALLRWVELVKDK
jgi:outer membrane protein OmpA-like peptidoglycan-associated protein